MPTERSDVVPVPKRDTVGPSRLGGATFLLVEGEVHCGHCGWCYVGGTEMERMSAFVAHTREHKRY